MTREEAISNLNMISVAFVEPVTEEQRKLIDDTFEMAIKALQDKGRDRKKAKRFKNKYLKLKTAIGKIKAEIEALEDKMLNVPNDWRTSEVFENVLDVIDKYRESEEE